MPVENLSDAQNFGQWLEKINEVIDALNNTTSVSDAVDAIIDKATENGQIGDTLSKTIHSSYDEYITNGVYYVPDTVTNRPVNDDTHLYVAVYGDFVTQFAFSIESVPRLFMRCKYSSESAFSDWYYIPSSEYNDSLYLKKTGGTITGDLRVDGKSIFDTITVENTSNFHGDLNIENTGVSLLVKNDKNTVTFSSQEELPIAFYIQENGDVTKDREGTDLRYHLYNNKLINYNIVYYIQRNKDTITTDENGTRIEYYVQDDNSITVTKTGNDVRYYIDGKRVLSQDRETVQWYIKNENFYSYAIQYYKKENIIYTDEECTLPRFHIEDEHKVVFYRNYAYITDDGKKISKDIDGQNVLYYVHDGKYTQDEEGLNVIYYVKDDKVSTDEDGVNVVYYIYDNTIIEKEIQYYINEDTITSDEEYTDALFYISDNQVIALQNIAYYRQHVLDTVTSDEAGRHTVYYIQENNTLTSDKEGNVINYYIDNDEVKDSEYDGNVVYYIMDEKLKSYEINFYIQDDGNITSDEEGENLRYKLYGNEIYEGSVPITVSLSDNIADINGSADWAYHLKKTGMTDSYKGEALDKAASGKALLDLFNYAEGRFLPYHGGTLTGLVRHTDDILMGLDNENRQTKIYSYGSMIFECLKETSIIANGEGCELYLDKQNEAVNLKPCIFGARTRTGITADTIGTPVYALGTLEFTEDTATLRVRKKNLTDIEEIDEKPDIAVTLSRKDDDTNFLPSEDAVVSLGSGSLRFNQVYSASGTISTSDRTQKTDISNISDELLDKWGKIEWKSFRYKDAVAKKSNARIHTGLIAQDVEDILKETNYRSYGFFCKDSWNDMYDTQYITIPASYDNSGVLLRPSYTKIEKKLVKSAGELYSLRYQEIQAIENAYLRREIENLKKEIKNLKKSLKSS